MCEICSENVKELEMSFVSHQIRSTTSELKFPDLLKAGEIEVGWISVLKMLLSSFGTAVSSCNLEVTLPQSHKLAVCYCLYPRFVYTLHFLLNTKLLSFLHETQLNFQERELGS